MVLSLLKEINLSEHFIPANEVIDTVYFGGGTPSLLTTNELALVFESLYKKFHINGGVEITLEANPDDINKSNLREWKNTGINRLSLGIQSFKEEELRWMNRSHTAKQSLQSIDEIQEAGFNNFSADLIFGSPLSANADLGENLQIIFEKNIPHISCYALTVEPKTALYKMIKHKISMPVNSDKQAEQFLLLTKMMKQNNYEHYEISNFAKPGMRSKHNSSYWQGIAYQGFGPSAHSFNGFNKRRWNIANNSMYIQSLKKDKITFEEESLSDDQRLNEYIMTSLRTIEGIDISLVSLKFGEHRTEKLQAAVQKYIAGKKITIQNKNIVLTNEGKLFADGIAADLFF